jgi:predicted metal-binding membrane protein
MVAVTTRTRTLPAVAVLGGAAAAAWSVLVAGIGGHTDHDDLFGHGQPPEPAQFAALFAGWLLMIIAMMVPPEAGALIRNRLNRSGVVASVGVIALTAAVWMIFGAVVLAGDSVLHEVAEDRPWLARLVTPTVLIGCGLFGLTPIKQRALRTARCTQALSWSHVAGCMISCGTLMLVMFAFGVGSLFWMAVLTAIMIAERVLTASLADWLSRLVGIGLIIAGVIAAVS